MSDINNENNIPYVIIRKDRARTDRKLQLPNNNGRKVLSITLYENKERNIQEPEWKPGESDKEKTPILVTGPGGLEVATFNQNAKQEAHKHLIGTEIYTVLEGVMEMIIDEQDVIKLKEGDEIVILPNTAHEILTNRPFLVRVHCVNCYGANDKYVKVKGEWKLK